MTALKNKPVQPGMVVSSKAGHDRNRLYLVIRSEDDRVWLTDGRYRTIDKQKVKNVRHVRIRDESQQDTLLESMALLKDSGQKNAMIRRLLADYITQTLKPSNGRKADV